MKAPGGHFHYTDPEPLLVPVTDKLEAFVQLPDFLPEAWYATNPVGRPRNDVVESDATSRSNERTVHRQVSSHAFIPMVSVDQ